VKEQLKEEKQPKKDKLKNNRSYKAMIKLSQFSQKFSKQ